MLKGTHGTPELPGNLSKRLLRLQNKTNRLSADCIGITNTWHDFPRKRVTKQICPTIGLLGHDYHAKRKITQRGCWYSERYRQFPQENLSYAKVDFPHQQFHNGDYHALPRNQLAQITINVVHTAFPVAGFEEVATEQWFFLKKRVGKQISPTTGLPCPDYHATRKTMQQYSYGAITSKIFVETIN